MWNYIIAAGLSAGGGLARILNKKDKRILTAFKITSELFVSAFVGLMVYLFLRWVNLADSPLMGLLSGLAGWIGPQVLDGIIAKVKKAVGLEDKPPEDKDKKDDDKDKMG